jgi:amidase
MQLQFGSSDGRDNTCAAAVQTTRRAVLGSVSAATGIAVLGGLVRASAAKISDTVWSTATDLVRALAAREVSSRELVDEAIARIEALDPKINAVVVRDFDRARVAADVADAAYALGERRPLLGLPMTVKEQFNVVGLPTTWGYPRFRGWRANFDALTVSRLKAAGAIILGKTNVPVGLTDWQSFNEVYGTTNNPWDPQRTPGGSSGGAAAVLAAGFVPLELGSDIGGSLRCPAHFCGVFSHKPSLDLIPQRGSGPPEVPPIPVRSDLAVIGPMARSAADLELALGVLAGPDPLSDGIGYKLDLPEARHDRLADFNVLVLDQHPLCPTDDSIRTAINRLADDLAGTGARVVRSHPDMPDLARTTRTYVELLTASFSADLPPEDRVRYQTAAAALSPDDLSLTAAFLRGYGMTHAAWINTLRIREGLRARWRNLFQEVDAMLCPAHPVTAFPHDHAPMQTRHLSINGTRVSYNDQVVWAAVATSAGLPATVAPIAQDIAGLPIGVQIIGGFLQDHTTIALAGLLAQAFGGFKPPAAYKT